MEKHDELIEALGALTHDPLAFVYFAILGESRGRHWKIWKGLMNGKYKS